MSKRFRARWLVPVETPPIQDAWIEIDHDGTVLRFGSGGDDCQDLGDVAILPALVNAHTHLEFSELKTPIGRPGMPLAHWIGLVIKSRSGQQAETTLASIDRGIVASREAGVGLIADIASPPNVVSGSFQQTSVLSFPEVLGLSPDRFDQRLQLAKDYQCEGISPHAPYSVRRSDIDQVVRLATRQKRLVAMHIAESTDERELCFHGTGNFAHSLREIGVWNDDLFPWTGETNWCGVIQSLSKAPAVLIVHGNDLNPMEMQCLAKHCHLTIVYCARTHHFFGYPKHPIDDAWKLGIRVALGTDSLASNPDLSIWREVQFLLNHRPDLDPSGVIAAATMHGADALGRPQAGRICVGANPGLIQIPTMAKNLDQLHRDFATSPDPRFIDLRNRTD